MSKQPTYFSTFKTCCKNGKSPWQCVESIAKKQGCTETTIWNKLCKANLAFCKKFNGHNCYFPVNFNKGTSKTWNKTQWEFCWTGIEFCLQHGWCTPEQIYSWTPGQICWFMGYCMTKNFKKPANFNPNGKVKGFPMSWGTMTTTTKTTGKKSNKKSTSSKTCNTTKAKRGTKSTTKKTHKPAKTYKFSARKYRTRKAA